MANFETCRGRVLDYGCGQGKLCEYILEHCQNNKEIQWMGIDQSPEMVQRFTERCIKKYGTERCGVQLLPSGDPDHVQVDPNSIDRFVSTYCLDLLFEDDIYKILDLAKRALHRHDGLLLLVGITWGYRASVQTFAMTALWELLYQFQRERVRGCRPQNLEPYLTAKKWRIVKRVRTLPNGFPWMVSEVIPARPPIQ